MEKERLEILEDIHGLESWFNSNTLGENLFIWKYFLSGDEIPGWKIHKMRPVEAPECPPSIQSIWKCLESDVETLLRVDVYESSSRAAAHRFLVRLLGEFQSPRVTRMEQSTIGDVTFSTPENWSILLARANLIILVRNAGRSLVPVTEVASRFDKDLVSKKGTEGEKVVPRIHRFAIAPSSARTGVPSRLEIEATDPLQRPLWYKFFSDTGEIFLDKGQPAYRPTTMGPQNITVFAVNSNHGVMSDELKFKL